MGKVIGMLNKSEMGWVDFSSEDRDRVRDVIKQLSEPGTLDELGVGALRDGFADLMFPGFSTIQTRAKYLITIPRIIRDYLALKPAQQRRQSLQQYLEQQENQLARALTLQHLNEGVTGIIGSTMKEGESVARLPSSVYWVALRTWGIINTQASLNQFLRSVKPPESSLGSNLPDEADDADGVSADSRVHLDRYDPQWIEDVHITLTESEAVFLSDKLQNGPINSLPSQLELSGMLKEVLDEDLAGFAHLAGWVAAKSDLAQSTRDTVKMAHAFSELIYGAHLRFNILVARNNQREDLVNQYESHWLDWRKVRQAGPEQVMQWLAATNITLQGRVGAFLMEWSEHIANNASVVVLDALVEKQALGNKKERSILKKRLPDNYRWIGMSRLDFRWSQVRTILGDIQEGLPC